MSQKSPGQVHAECVTPQWFGGVCIVNKHNVCGREGAACISLAFLLASQQTCSSGRCGNMHAGLLIRMPYLASTPTSRCACVDVWCIARMDAAGVDRSANTPAAGRMDRCTWY
jgi:hypothetical protein